MGCGGSAAKKGAEEPVAPADNKAKADAEAKANADAEAKAKAEAAKRRLEATEKYVETVTSLASTAVAERPLKMSSLEFADDVAERIRRSGAQDEWVKAAFAHDVATEADLAGLVRALLGAHLRRSAPAVAAAALWDARRAAILLCGPQDRASTGDKLSSLGASEASSLLRDTFAQTGQAPELAASLAALEEKLQELSKELAAAIEGAATGARGDLERRWARALDPQGSGRLDSRGASEAMLHGGAQGFAAVAFDMRLVVGPVREALQKLATAAGALQEPVRSSMGAAAARASAELEQVDALDARTLLQECVFPLAGALPLSMPVLRTSALEAGRLGDLRREAATAAEQPAPPGQPEAETMLEDVEDDEAEKGTLLFC